MLKRLNFNQIDEDGSSPEFFNLRVVVSFVRRNIALMVAIVAVAMLIASIHLARQVPRYTAFSEVLIDPGGDRNFGRSRSLSLLYLRNSGADANQVAIIRSVALLRRVVIKLRLVRDSEFGIGTKPDTPAWTLAGAISSLFSGSASSASGPAQPAAPDETNSEVIDATARALSGAVRVKRRGRSFVLAISVTSLYPKKAKLLANAIADAYLLDMIDTRFDAAKRASRWLGDQVIQLRKQLRKSEEAVVAFRAKTGLTGTGRKITLNQQQLGELNSKLVAARADTAEKKARFEQVALLRKKRGNLASLPNVMASATIGRLRQQFSVVSQREADLVARYGKRHPKVVNVRAERREVRRAIGAEISRIADNVDNEYRLSLARQKSLELTLAEVSGRGGTDDKVLVRLRELQRTAAVNRTLFNDLLAKAKSSDGRSTYRPQLARIITTARLGRQSFPNHRRVWMIALFFGLVAAAGGAFAREALNAGFSTIEQVENTLGVPLLASVNRLRPRDLVFDGTEHKPHFLNKIKPLSRYSESIRAIRSGVQMADVDTPTQILQITSSLPSEGKSTIALSLAVSAATAGKRVLIIDADMRNPTTTKNLQLESGVGLVDYLTGAVELEDAVKSIEALNIWAMPTGAKTTNPSDLLGSERMKTMLASLRKSFDYIIVDTPPVEPLIDPRIVSCLVDKAVVVVKWGSTDREAVRNTIGKLDPQKRIAGVVLNFVNERQVKQYARYAGYYNDKSYSKYFDE